MISFLVVFIICVLLAFFSGSSILLSLFKALVSACLAVIFLALASFFLAKYIPDFFDDKSKIDTPDSGTMGSNVDIRIDDSSVSSMENDVTETSSAKGSFSSASDFEKTENIQKDENSEYGSSLSSDVKPMNFENEDLNEEKREELPTDSMQKTTPELKPSVVDDAELSQAELSQTIENDVDRLEELPDLQEFVDTSNLKPEQTKGEELMNTGTQSFFETDLSENVTDTNLMAKAVRTVLKRDI